MKSIRAPAHRAYACMLFDGNCYNTCVCQLPCRQQHPNLLATYNWAEYGSQKKCVSTLLHVRHICYLPVTRSSLPQSMLCVEKGKTPPGTPAMVSEEIHKVEWCECSKQVLHVEQHCKEESSCNISAFLDKSHRPQQDPCVRVGCEAKRGV